MGSEYYVRIVLRKKLTDNEKRRIVRQISDLGGEFLYYDFKKENSISYTEQQVEGVFLSNNPSTHLMLNSFDGRLTLESIFDDDPHYVLYLTLLHSEIRQDNSHSITTRMAVDKIITSIKEIRPILRIEEFINSPKSAVTYVHGEEGFSGFWERWHQRNKT